MLPVFSNQRMTTISSSCSESHGKLGTCGQVKERLWETRHKPCVLIPSEQRQGMTEPSNILRWKSPTRIIESNRMKLIKALSIVSNPRLQNYFPKKAEEESPSAQPFKPKKCSHCTAEKMPTARGEELVLFTFCLPSAQKFYKAQLQHNRILREHHKSPVSCATNRGRGYQIILKASAAHTCSLETLQKVLFFRERRRKGLSFYFYPTYALLSSSCISPQTVTIEAIKLLHATDPRQWLITVISSD